MCMIQKKQNECNYIIAQKPSQIVDQGQTINLRGSVSSSLRRVNLSTPAGAHPIWIVQIEHVNIKVNFSIWIVQIVKFAWLVQKFCKCKINMAISDLLCKENKHNGGSLITLKTINCRNCLKCIGINISDAATSIDAHWKHFRQVSLKHYTLCIVYHLHIVVFRAI